MKCYLVWREKDSKENMRYSYEIVWGQVFTKQDFLKKETLHFSNSYDQLIINLTNNNQIDSLVFGNVVTSILNKESKQKNKKSKQEVRSMQKHYR